MFKVTASFNGVTISAESSESHPLSLDVFDTFIRAYEGVCQKAAEPLNMDSKINFSYSGNDICDGVCLAKQTFRQSQFAGV